MPVRPLQTSPDPFTLGDATLHILNAGDLRVHLAAWLGVHVKDWPKYCDVLAQPIASPMQTVHIAFGAASEG